MPQDSQAIPEGYFQAGEAVVYHSRTYDTPPAYAEVAAEWLRQWHFAGLGGFPLLQQSLWRKGGLMIMILAALIAPNHWQCHAVMPPMTPTALAKPPAVPASEVLDSVEAESVSRKHRGNVLTELPSPLHVENAERWHSEAGGDGILYSAARQGRPSSSPLQDSQGGKVKTGTETRRQHEGALAALAGGAGLERFNVGDKVFPGVLTQFYESKTHGRKIVATVERVTDDGFYDLKDVKKSAHPSYISRFVEQPSPATAPVEPSPAAAPPAPPPRVLPPILPSDQEDLLPRQVTRVVLPLQKAYSGNDGFAATDCSGATPIGFSTPATAIGPLGFSTPSRYGEDDATKAVKVLERPGSFALIRQYLIGEGARELRVGPGGFNPRVIQIRTQLVQQLGLPSHAQIQEMSGFKGGLNQGIWLVNGGTELVLKQVRTHCFSLSHLCGSADVFVLPLPQNELIVQDPAVAFPVLLGVEKIFSCVGAACAIMVFPESFAPGDDRRPVSDLIVMKKSRGERLCEYVATKFYANQVPQLCIAMEAVGRTLHTFHDRYGHQQHGDFQPSNIYYDESTNSVSFIDVGGMGVPTTGNDLEHFHQCMRSMTIGYDPQLHVDLLSSFSKGYQSSPLHQAGRAGRDHLDLGPLGHKTQPS
ncbi:unnamed protein product [Symbiodinium natans]|uniref:Protein kinase domain-containing protein n=1 Tax=Symbiodinium natans TaxID=878477 RepID=A0A812L8W1_9DINO|nr:unnamed protein product [Symbiodinium natans]